MPISDPPLGTNDYEAIEAAVMETSRGRWFLAEYARRNRHADTEMLLSAMGRLENVVHSTNAASMERLHAGLVDMAAIIDDAKGDVAALRAPKGAVYIGEATEELDSVVAATEAAASDILSAAEQIQETAWIMREQGLDAAHCDRLDARATDIYTACSFQDLTGQRTRKVIQVLRYLEGRIDAMIGFSGASEVDAGLAADAASLADSTLHSAVPPVATPEPRIVPSPTADPFAPLAALSYEQKIALFT